MGHRHKHIPDEDGGFEDDDALVDRDEGFGPFWAGKAEAMMANAEYERMLEERRRACYDRAEDDGDDDDDDLDGDEDHEEREETFPERVSREARERQQQWREESWKAYQEKMAAQTPPQQPSILARIWRSLFGS